MKKILPVFIALVCGAAFAADSETTKMRLVQPELRSADWGPKLNRNFEIIDASVPVLSGPNVHRGTDTFTQPITFLSSITFPNVSITTATDNLGSHVATTTIQAPYGMSVSTINAADTITGARAELTSTSNTLTVGSTGDYSAGTFYNNEAGANSFALSVSQLAGNAAAGKFVVDQSTAIRGQATTGTGAYFTSSGGRALETGAGSVKFSTLTVSRCVETDASGNLTSASGSCGSGGADNLGTHVATKTLSTSFGMIANNASSNTVAPITLTSTGAVNAIKITENGIPSSGLQNDTGGALNIRLNSVAEGMVITSSISNSQAGASYIWMDQQNPGWNDPLLYINDRSSNSAGQMKLQAYAPNFELVNLSTAGSLGRGKFEPFAMAYQSARLQFPNSRAYDNTTFENQAYWEPLSAVGAGYYIQSQSLANDSAVLSSSDTQGVHFFGQNGRTVGITGPLNPLVGSYSFGLPSTPNNLGQIMAQVNNGRGNNNNTRQLEFTTGGSTTSLMQFTGGLPVWNSGPAVSSLTVAGTGAGQIYLTEGSSATIAAAAGTDVMWADSSSHTFVFSPNGGPNYTVVGSSAGATIGNLARWSSQGTIVDGGSGSGGGDNLGGHVSTKTLVALFGIQTDSITVYQPGNTSPGAQETYGIMIGTNAISMGQDVQYGYIQTWQSRPLQLQNQGNNTLINSGSGNVGIGTLVPNAKLHVSSNTILPGATFYHNAPAQIGSAILNTLTPGTLYLDASSNVVSVPSTYRRPKMMWIDSNTYEMEGGNVDGTSNKSCIAFPDGSYRCATETATTQTHASRRFVGGETASWGTVLNAGLNPTEVLTATSTIAFYAVKSTASSTAFTMVGTTAAPVSSNYGSLNTVFGTNGWVYLGMGQFHDNCGTEALTRPGFVPGYHAGSLTTFGGLCGGTTGNYMGGIKMASGSGSAAHTYSAGMVGSSKIPPNVTLVNWAGNMAGSNMGGFIRDAGTQGTARPDFVVVHSTVGVAAMVTSGRFYPATKNVTLNANAAGTCALHIVGWIDDALAGIGLGPGF